MTLCAVEFLERCGAACCGFVAVGRLRRDDNRRFGLFGRKARRECLDIGDDVEPLRVANCIPAWHVRAIQAIYQHSLKVSIGRQGARRRAAPFEGALTIVTRFGTYPLSKLTLAVALIAMARYAIPLVDKFSLAHVPRVLCRGRTCRQQKYDQGWENGGYASRHCITP